MHALYSQSVLNVVNGSTLAVDATVATVENGVKREEEEDGGGGGGGGLHQSLEGSSSARMMMCALSRNNSRSFLIGNKWKKH